MPLSDAWEATTLDWLYGRDLYLRLLNWSGDPNAGKGVRLNPDASFPAGLAEVTTGGYAPLFVDGTGAGNQWAAAVPGAPTEKQVPKTGGNALAFSPTGGATWTLSAYCWTTTNAAITSANYVSGGVLLGGDLLPTVRTVTAANPLNFTDVTPIIERLGDPPIACVDPT